MKARRAESYTTTAKYFHWGMGVLIIGMLCLGLYMVAQPMGPDKLRLIGLHKSTGAIILGLLLLRFTWRMFHAVPALPADLHFMFRAGARAAHYALYALMLLMPLSGWAMSSAAGFPVSVFGLFLLPNIVPPDKKFAHLMVTAHNWMAYTLIGLLVLHVLAALWHLLVRRDNVFRSMWFSKA